ncbi:single-stranded-DNA-specific exonuclease RecJ, partial [Candidatus Gottesmanbacteria bacterium]|nr:single-stranded-DNA-specific exonuclease RecJ [Candidatus Gottesmanbacteria bacterium]
VVSKGKVYSKASARSINGFNIVEAIRSCSDILVDVGGHPMAAGFTVETKNLMVLQERLEKLVEKELDDSKFTRTLKIDAEIPLDMVTPQLYKALQQLQPFGFGNPEPVFATRGVNVTEARLVGADGKHLKFRVVIPAKAGIQSSLDAIAFNLGHLYSQLQSHATLDLAYTIALDTWNGNSRLQLKIRDIQ